MDNADPSYYTLQVGGAPTTGLSCRHLSNPTVASQMSTLIRALHNAHGFLNRFADHDPLGCVVIDRILDLDNLLP
jgi:hypothetical protein